MPIPSLLLDAGPTLPPDLAEQLSQRWDAPLVRVSPGSPAAWVDELVQLVPDLYSRSGGIAFTRDFVAPDIRDLVHAHHLHVARTPRSIATLDASCSRFRIPIDVTDGVHAARLQVSATPELYVQAAANVLVSADAELIAARHPGLWVLDADVSDAQSQSGQAVMGDGLDWMLALDADRLVCLTRCLPWDLPALNATAQTAGVLLAGIQWPTVSDGSNVLAALLRAVLDERDTLEGALLLTPHAPAAPTLGVFANLSDYPADPSAVQLASLIASRVPASPMGRA